MRFFSFSFVGTVSNAHKKYYTKNSLKNQIHRKYTIFPQKMAFTLVFNFKNRL